MNFEFVSTVPTCPIAQEIACYFNKQLIVPMVTTFADGEIEVIFPDSSLLKNKQIFIIQSTQPPVHENLMRLLLTCFALKNNNVSRIIGIVPYFGYARHDKSMNSSLRYIASIIQSSGIDTLITVALHTQDINSFFSIPVHSIPIKTTILQHINNFIPTTNNNCVVVAPDRGAHELALSLADSLGVGYVLCSKERYNVNATKILDAQFHNMGSTAIIIDDIIDTGSTALNTCDYLKGIGITDMYGYFIHPVLSGTAVHKMNESSLKKIFVSSTIPLNYFSKKFETFSITDELIKTISTMV